MLQDFERHLLARGRAAGTIAHRMADIHRLRLEHPDLLEVKLEDLEHILARAYRAGREPETRQSMRSSYRVFYAWAHRTGRMSYDPSFHLENITVPMKIARMAPDDVIQMSLITATLEQQAMVLLARLACLRLSELTMLKLRDRVDDALLITSAGAKGGKERIVYANDQLLSVLLERERELGGGTYYFPGRFGGHMHPQSVNKIITRVTGWNPHSLRHAGATAAFRATHDIRAVSDMLGHSSIAITHRYIHPDEDTRRAAGRGTAFLQPASSPHFPNIMVDRWQPDDRKHSA